MATLLQIVGILSLFGGFLIGMSSLPNPAALLAGTVSGLLSLIVFWWMAAVLTGIRGTEESVEEAVEVLKQIAASVAPKEPGQIVSETAQHRIREGVSGR